MTDIFKHRDLVDFLQAAFEERRKRNPSYSLRSWAKLLGFNDAAALSLTLNRKRSPSKQVRDTLKKSLLASQDEREYFDIIANATCAEDKQTKEFYERLAANFKPMREKVLLQLQQFQLVSCWYHFVILEMTRLSDFQENIDWIAEKLMNKVSKRDLRTALVRLIELGLLRRNAQGRLERHEIHQKVETDVSNVALCQLHTQMIGLGLEALQEQDRTRRDITGFNTITNRDKIPEAKRMIERFRQQLMNYLEDPTGDTVYQVNVQMFDLLS